MITIKKIIILLVIAIICYTQNLLADDTENQSAVDGVEVPQYKILPNRFYLDPIAMFSNYTSITYERKLTKQFWLSFEFTTYPEYYYNVTDEDESIKGHTDSLEIGLKWYFSEYIGVQRGSFFIEGNITHYRYSLEETALNISESDEASFVGGEIGWAWPCFSAQGQKIEMPFELGLKTLLGYKSLNFDSEEERILDIRKASVAIFIKVGIAF